MIVLTRLDGPAVAVNCDLIEHVEQAPCTVLTLVDGTQYVVKESMAEVVERIRDFRASVVVTAQRMESEFEAAPDLRVIPGEGTFTHFHGENLRKEG